MLKKLRQGQKGFTLIELLIVIAIIGIIAALLIPNFLDALQKAKQKRTMGDTKSVGTAMFSWVTDMAQGAAAGTTFAIGSYPTSIGHSGVSTILVPRYMQDIPQRDGWKNNYDFRLDTLNPSSAQYVMAIVSPARGGSADTSWIVGGFEPTDYNQDIVWAEGYFVRWPGKTT